MMSDANRLCELAARRVHNFFKVFENIKHAFFATRNLELIDMNQIELKSKVGEGSFLYPKFLSNYLQECQRRNKNSLCKTMQTFTSKRSRFFFVDGAIINRQLVSAGDCQDEFKHISRVLGKLRKCDLKRSFGNPEDQITRCLPLVSMDKCTSNTSLKIHYTCEKAVQCSKDTEFLKVSSDLKFCSRSSYPVNVNPSKQPAEARSQPQQNQQSSQRWRSTSSSLEHVANYRPEFQRQPDKSIPNLCNFSPGATFGRFQRNKCNYGASCQRNKSRRRLRNERLRDALQRSEDETYHCSNLIEEDLPSHQSPRSLKSQNHIRNDSFTSPEGVLGVKNILLEDYMTEINEIVCEETRKLEAEGHESRILKRVKRRMDEDLPTKRTSSSSTRCSWHTCELHSTSRSRTSNDAARDHPCYHCCCYCCCRKVSCCNREFASLTDCCKTKNDEALWKSRSYTIRGRNEVVLPEEDEHLLRSSSYVERETQTDLPQIIIAQTRGAAKSSHSVDSGVVLDFPREPADWHSSDASTSRLLYANPKHVSGEESDSSSGARCTDEMLCQRVESAVKKFTKELILCERKVKDRSRAKIWRLGKRKSYSSREGILNSSKSSTSSSSSSSEETHITGISTPSLVSL